MTKHGSEHEDQLMQKHGYLFLEWKGSRILFTCRELEKIHRSFFHPHPRKLYNMMKRARPTETTKGTLKELQDISDNCKPCAVHRRSSNRFRTSLPPDEIKFNDTNATMRWI